MDEQKMIQQAMQESLKTVQNTNIIKDYSVGVQLNQVEHRA